MEAAATASRCIFAQQLRPPERRGGGWTTWKMPTFLVVGAGDDGGLNNDKWGNEKRRRRAGKLASETKRTPAIQKQSQTTTVPLPRSIAQCWLQGTDKEEVHGGNEEERKVRTVSSIAGSDDGPSSGSFS